MREPFDLVVIGGGPAGEKGAAQAAYFGKKVALIEREDYLGGAGINTGTVPSKTLRETALYFSGLKQRGLYGIDYALNKNLDVHTFLHREKQVVGALRDVVRANLEKHAVTVIRGSAKLTDANTVEVAPLPGEGDAVRTLEAKVILIATGSSPFHPPGLPFEKEDVYDSDEILSMDAIPKSMVVLGGGVIGCEYASIFQALDVQVTLVDGRDRLLPFLDKEMGDLLFLRLQKMGMKVVFGERVKSVDAPETRGVRLLMESGMTLSADKALFATGRQSNVAGLGLETVGVKLGVRGVVVVDSNYATNIPSVYAAGDVIGFPALASTSMEQARVAMCHAFGLTYKSRVSAVIPLTVYTIPEVSMVGQTEEELITAKVPHVVGRAFYRDLPRGQIIGDVDGLIKLLVEYPTKKLLGAHVAGESASELIHIASACMQESGTIDRFIEAVFNYPTLGDGYKFAAYQALGAIAKRAAESP